MCKRKSLIAAPVVALLLLAGARAEAGPISFGFNFTPGTADLSHPLVVQPSGALAALADGDTGGMVTFTNEPANTATATFNTNTSSYTTTITATNLRTVSTASPNSPDTLNASGAYSLSLVLTSPDPSAAPGLLVFTGKLGGTFSGSNSANITNAFTSATEQSIQLGAYLFNVWITGVPGAGFTPPGGPASVNAGGISAFVEVIDNGGAGGTGTIQSLPEPSTMALSFLGLTTFGAGWLRRRFGAATR